jgi:hypothetical protein
MAKESLRDLLGYERRLHRMTRAQLLEEAQRVSALDRMTLIRAILAAQDINPDALR